MLTPISTSIHWQQSTLTSPHLPSPVSCIVARDLPYGSNRLQTLTVYLRHTPESSPLVGHTITSLPQLPSTSTLPATHVHIHGGAWRDPNLLSSSAEAFAAHAFAASAPLNTIISLNYTLSPFPTHPSTPYDATATPGKDPAREATHPQHVRDVLAAFALLRSLGLEEGFLLSGHSAGACLAFQAVLGSPEAWNAAEAAKVSAAPRPAALIGMNGLYDLPALVHGLGATHEQLSGVYADLLGFAFGEEGQGWVRASPALFPVEEVGAGVKGGRVPRLVLVDQSVEDQLVPVNQADRMQGLLEKVEGIKVVRGNRCVGRHAAPWEEGVIIWDTVVDVLGVLREMS